MKRILYFISALLLLTSCFKDTGNYDYLELNPPRWLSENYGEYRAYGGSKITIDGEKLFVWEKDSAIRAQNSRYEWVLNGKLISDQLKFEMPVEELMQKAGLKEYNVLTCHDGVFKIIEKESGISFQKKINFWFYPYYSSYDWAILSDNDGKASLSTLRRRWKSRTERVFLLKTNAFEEHNNNKTLVGKPIELSWCQAKHLGVSGAYTVITDQANYVISAHNLEYVGALEEEFLDGVPAGFKPVSRADIDASGDGRAVTFVATEDGKVYTRVMGANYLGGRFLSEPYEVDAKGYEIDLFGTSRFAANFLCHDKKNNRILFASQFIERLKTNDGTMGEIPVYRTRLTPLEDTPGIALSGLGDNIEVLALRATSHYPGEWFNFIVRQLESMYTIFYNKADDPSYTYTADIAVSNQNMRVRDLTYKSNVKLPRINKDDVILTTGNLGSAAYESRMRAFFSRTGDNAIYYYVHNSEAMAPGISGYKLPVEITSKVTAMAMDYYGGTELMIGCENGDVFFYDISVISQPKLFFKGNVGGKVMSFRELGTRTAYNDR